MIRVQGREFPTSGNFEFSAQASAVTITASARAATSTGGNRATSGAGGPGELALELHHLLVAGMALAGKRGEREKVKTA